MSKGREPEAAGVKSVSAFAELRSAGLLVIGLIALIVVLLYTVGVLSLRGEDGKFEVLGQFGDSFGALTSLFNALAFAALIVTVVLQSRELRESRQELSKQAEAQKAWAAAALRQIEVTERLERLKIRPLVSLVWNDEYLEESSEYSLYLSARNDGLGAAIIDEVGAQSGLSEVLSYRHTDDTEVQDKWGAALHQAGVGHDQYHRMDIPKLRDGNRAIAAGSSFNVVDIVFRSRREFDHAKRIIQFNFRPFVKYRSLDDESFDTRTQHIVRAAMKMLQ